jgi:hypothetical protein
MKRHDLRPEDARLRALLSGSPPSPVLPPRFQEGVWRRIESTEARQAAESPGWLDSLVMWVFRPKFALTAVAALVLVGVILGVQQGTQTARQVAQAHYLAAVAPNAER